MDSILNRMQTLRLNESTNNNFRQVSVYPTAHDLIRPSTQIPINIIKGPYQSTEHYLRTHFTLLREDFYKPIREDLRTFREDPLQPLNSIKIHSITFIRRGVKRGDICHCLELKEKIQMNDKRFMFGSLLIFSKDNTFKSIFCGRVADTRNIRDGKILVNFEHTVKLQFDQYYSMIECDNFFEPYYQVLKVIQSTRSHTFSMQQYLVQTESTVMRPEYLDGIKYTVRDPELNVSQLAALNGALSQELAIVQGPPGTGKTFLGLKIVEQLLSLSRKWYHDSPLLIISLTNHALDHFLEGVTKYTRNILRCGARSQNPEMKNYTIAERRKDFYGTVKGKHYRATESPLYKRYASIESQINDIENALDLLKSKNPRSIFDINLLSNMVPKVKELFLNKPEKIVSWLLEEKEDDDIHRQNMEKYYNSYLKPEMKSYKYSVLSLSVMETVIKDLTGKIAKLQRENELAMRPKLRELQKAKIFLSKKLEYFKSCLKREEQKIDRWELYRRLLVIYATHLTEKMDELIEKYLLAYNDLFEVQDETNLAMMKHQKVIGMTTTMAARMHSTIRALKCPIVLVEEAAQVLEAHIIPVLTEHCQHLILIGDHQQLRPCAADYVIENKHNLGISLFERMVKNDVQCYTLNVQHRMRPEVSCLITPSIYPVLHDHASVKKFPPIRGVKKNVYFITHSEPEGNSGVSSKKNLHEAKFLIQLAEYLLKNNYKPEEITILAAYLGQVDCLTAEQNSNTSIELKKVQITSIDNFQGEENKIILLSLVRNNPEMKVGFLATKNRVCVALSRAKEGLYIMGNIRHLAAQSKLWKSINESLVNQNAVGKRLALKCQRHNKITEISEPKQFSIECPEGGCTIICNAILKCGHKCSRACHNDEQHKSSSCKKESSKSIRERRILSFMSDFQRLKI